MQEKTRIIFALTLSALLHLFVLTCLPEFSNRIPQSIRTVLEANLVQVSVSEPKKTVAQPPALQPVLTRDIPDDEKNIAAITAPIVASPILASPPASQAGDIAVTEPRYKVSYLNNPAPDYPLSARRRGLEGRVILHVQVLSDGSSATINVKQSSGHVLLDQAAQATVQRWRFVPAMQGKEAVSAWVEVPIAFKLER